MVNPSQIAASSLPELLSFGTKSVMYVIFGRGAPSDKAMGAFEPLDEKAELFFVDLYESREFVKWLSPWKEPVAASYCGCILDLVHESRDIQRLIEYSRRFYDVGSGHGGESERRSPRTGSN